jgi:predicted RNase H-like nuclease (RuvC/YqgF family)
MTSALVIEILLGLIAAAVGFVSYVMANRASKAQSNVAIVSIDAQAYERAQTIYESAISTLERRVANLESQVDHLTKQNEEQARELSRLRFENAGLRDR